MENRVIMNREFWGEAGRVGRIGAGAHTGAYIFAYPDTLPQWWTLVIEPSPYPDRPGEDYVFGDHVLSDIIDSLQVNWLEPGPSEVALEQSIFQRRPLRSGASWL